MPLDFKHRYIFDKQITERGIFYVDVKISYKDKHIFNKFVFCKKNIGYFENGLKPHLKPLGIKQNLKDIVIIEISVITYLKDTMIV